VTRIAQKALKQAVSNKQVLDKESDK
jgi:hypothetical protein